jgi:hypothetical protein
MGAEYARFRGGVDPTAGLSSLRSLVDGEDALKGFIFLYE